mmetsp:Transcript_12153/g.12227  ORF Transcript_12153/g.12227 Transcript_12153/m.12227 type:complete len:495 (+) Transcript_12153:72-1556(+)|eukprot:CAMPEP_0182429036 /NCGR_PEP_ID=MMETSP1167-20130531/25466_1 /TAXON_ID=2988 /ORGANISM="Mallomonas Sp, Strain CCMP3275" /LENGTH=494 /DNA_ID=CAMNT_0024612335 /DNA_START=71 /DNA_END=1555 /DNA_ORIENTATION=-
MSEDAVLLGSNIPKTLEEIINTMPVRAFHYRLLIISGLGFMADALEISLLSFMSVCAGIDWELSSEEIATITSVVFIGEMAGALFWGAVADTYGRRFAYIIASIFITVPGLLSALSPNLPTLLVFRCLVGFGVGGFSVPFDLLAEYLPASHRGQFLVYMQMFWTMGSLMLAGIAWGSLSTLGWRFLTGITAVPVIIATIVSIYYLPESARWHLENGRVKEAETVIREASVVNGTELPPFSLELDPAVPRISTRDNNTLPGKSPAFGSTYGQLLTPEQRWVTVPLWVVWAVFGFTYYGVILFVARLFSSEDDKNVDECTFDYDIIFINASSEFFAVLFVATVIERMGRTGSQALFYLCSGLFVALMGANIQRGGLIAIASFARMFIFAASSVTWIATPEMFPTRIRATAHSVSSMMARIGAICAPYLVQSHVSVSVVGGVLCLVNLMGSLASLFLPETKGRALDEASIARANKQSSTDKEELVGLLTGSRSKARL